MNGLPRKHRKLHLVLMTCERKRSEMTHIRHLYRMESKQVVKRSKLTEVAVDPKPIERQKVSTVFKAFSDETVSALRTQHLAEDTNGAIYFLSQFIAF